MKAVAGIKRTANYQLNCGEIDVPAFVEEIESVTGKHKFTRKEMDEMRQKVDLIYHEYIKQQWEEEEQYRAPFIDTFRSAALESDRHPLEGWNQAHGPAPKKKKAVWDLSPGDRGIADRPSEPVDLDEMERQLEAKMMEEYIRKQAEEPQTNKGKRVRKDNLVQPMRAATKSFWI
jgi:hypothetical protein